MNKFVERVIYKLVKIKYIGKGTWDEYILSQNIGKEGREATSASDDDLYPNMCLLATKKKDIFSVFRRVDTYYKIVGGGSTEHVKKSVDYIDAFSSDDYKNWIVKNHKKFDRFGMPHTYECVIGKKNVGMSTSTSLHLRVLMDLVELFDLDNHKDIVEIGGGYGGLCSVVCTYVDDVNYSIIDLPEVNLLQEKYLSRFGLMDKVETISCFECKQFDRDVMLVSNYAFSELSREIQDVYFEKVVSKATCGYMLCNTISNDNSDLNGYSIEELQQKIPGSVVLSARPYKSHHRILVWGHKCIPDRFMD